MDTTHANTDPLLPLIEVARRLGISKQAVSDAVKRGTLRPEVNDQHVKFVRLSEVEFYRRRYHR